MRSTHGVSFLSLGSQSNNGEVSAVDYALSAVQEEIETQLHTRLWLRHAEAYRTVKDTLAYYLTDKFDKAFWIDVMRRAGLASGTEKEAEQLINTMSCLIVLPCSVGVLNGCAQHTASSHYRSSAVSEVQGLRDTGRTAKKLLSQWPSVECPENVWNGFREMASYELQQLYDSI